MTAVAVKQAGMIPAADPSGSRLEAIGFVGALAVHAGLIYLMNLERDDPPPPPPAMEVSFVEESALVSTAPSAEDEPAPSLGQEMGSPEEASAAEATVPDVMPQEAPPLPATRQDAPITPPVSQRPQPRPQPRPQAQRPQPQPQPRPPVQRPQAQPRPPAQRPQTRPPQQAQRPQATPQPRAAQPGAGSRPRSSGFDPRRLAESLGRGPPEARGTSPAPRGAATTQQRTSFTSALASKIARCSRQQRPSTQEARTLRPVVVIRLRQDGSLDGAPAVRSVEGLNDTNRQYETQAREAIIRAVRNCAPYTGLPVELYDVPNGWRQPPPIRLNFQ
jgi:outer membrane biosynthesis protein TonB